MGTEIVFVLIFPVVAACVLGSLLLWKPVAKMGCEAKIERLKAYVPLCAGFAVSMVAFAVLTYIESYADFTSLVREGYYTEAQRTVYLPGRVLGNAIVELVFLLPVISFVVVPMTTWLIRTNRLAFKGIGLVAILGWFVLSLLGWVLNVATITPSYPLLSFLASMAIPVLLYGLPIPVAAIWLLPPKTVGD